MSRDGTGALRRRRPRRARGLQPRAERATDRRALRRAPARTAARRASFTISPNPVKPGQTVTFNASASTRPGRHDRRLPVGSRRQRHIRDRLGDQPDRDEDVPTAQSAIPVAAARHDDQGRHRRRVDDADRRRTPRPRRRSRPRRTRAHAQPDRHVRRLGARRDRDGTIAKYEWDLDGNGTYETDHHDADDDHGLRDGRQRHVGLRVTDNDGATATTTRRCRCKPPRTARRCSARRASATTGASRSRAGRRFADSQGHEPGHATGGVTPGVAGALAGDVDTAARFNGSSGARPGAAQPVGARR